ncbi:RUN and SH3 domain-containing protein 1 isoform X4 [Enhydra lutris kenyoni]|uniref:RUN and SH3 domain-containing protein 1 isoform X4 n=1 Tax=Enhydra lutris kenyoni TaxID=391180 RepID=A0A2Y9IDX2_ENHLU|nr:RUN and SH3 domain-containing protein 1 isoform X4 [Enhydra lutris kenyoni]
MLSPQRALLCNLNHIHLQHVSLGLHLSRRPELREGPLSTPPPPGDTGGKESRGPCSGALVDANSNSPAVPCRCCQEHGPGLENRQDPAREEEGAASPSDPGCSSSLSSCSDLSPDESPISVYSRGLPGDEDVHPQPSIVPLEQGSPLGSVGPGACSPDSFCCSPDSCSGASSPPGPGLDSNCNALTTCQEPPSPAPEEDDDGGELDLPASELPEADDDGKADAGKTEPSWKINPIWKIDTETPGAGWKAAESSDSGCSTAGDSRPAKLDSGWAGRTAVTDGSSRTDAGWRSDVSEEPAAHRTITSFHELAQKRRRGPGLPLAPQVKKDRSDWLIVFSPDSELPPSGSLGGSPAPPREVTTFKELRSRSRAPPPPVPPRDPPAGWALVPPRPPPPPVPPRRRKNRPGLQPIAERPPEEGREGSPAAGQEAPAAREPEEPGAQAGRAARSSWSFAGAPGAQRRWMAEAQSGTGQLQEQKKGLLIAVSASVDKIISHFGAARNLVQKAQLGDSRLSPDVGHLVLTTLCPALHALVADGLKPFRKDLITGQRRSSPWSVVEASVKPGASSRALGSLYGQVSRLAPLSSSRSRFHAFILGLLNTKQLELWFSSLQEDAGSWWKQLTQASRVYASGGSEGFPLPRWRSWRPGPAAGGPQARPVPTEDTAPGRGLWLGRLFGVPGGLAETDGGPMKSRRPSSWLPPTVSVLALVKRGAPPEPLSPPEELEASAASVVQTHRAVRALCDHVAAGPEQLSFRRGEVLRVVATVDEDWLRCGRDGAEGLVPVGYTSLVL